jgi:hypothetical protein
MTPSSAPLTSSARTAVSGHDMTDRESERLEQLGAEARYHRQRLDLYRARLYSGRALSLARLEEFERASDGAAARLGQAGDAASPARPRG